MKVTEEMVTVFRIGADWPDMSRAQIRNGLEEVLNLIDPPVPDTLPETVYVVTDQNGDRWYRCQDAERMWRMGAQLQHIRLTEKKLIEEKGPLTWKGWH